MTNDLKQQFERLVAEPPPPSATPSEAVFARVRSVRRRRTAGALTLAAAAVVAVAVAAGNLTDINSSPPVTNTPSAPVTIVTGPPTSTPSATAPTTPTTGTGTTTTTQGTKTGTPETGTTKGSEKPAGATTTTGAGKTTTNTPPPVQPPVKPIQVGVVLKPTVTGRTVAVKVTVSGTVIVPTADGKDLPADTSFLNLSGGTQYYWGDGEQGGSDGGSVQCGGTTRRTGHETYSIDTHTYTKPGTYTLRYVVSYCNAKGGASTTTKTTKVTVK